MSPKINCTKLAAKVSVEGIFLFQLYQQGLNWVYHFHLTKNVPKVSYSDYFLFLFLVELIQNELPG